APDVLYSEMATATEWLASVLARRHGVRHLIPYPTPVADRLYFLDHPLGAWEPMRRAYLASRGRDLPPAAARRAADWLAAYRRDKLKPTYLKIGSHSPFHFDPVRFA